MTPEAGRRRRKSAAAANPENKTPSRLVSPRIGTTAAEMATMELSKRMRMDTHKVHREAESAGFMKAFMKGKLSKEEHTAYLVQLYHVYVALEAAYEEACQASAEKELLQTLYFPDQLDRVASLEEDLEYYLGKDWKENEAVVTPSPAAKAYADRMTELGQKDPILLVAHAYTRYLGDLSGGLMLGEVARKTFDLHDDEGLAFFTFAEIPDPDAFKNEYRERMNGLALSEDRAKEVSQEAILAFQLNIKLFQELDAQFGLDANGDKIAAATPAITDGAADAPAGACCLVM